MSEAEVEQSQRLIVKSIRALVSCDEQDQVYSNIDLVCEDGVITAMDENAASQTVEQVAENDRLTEIIDGQHLLVYPGLINTHHHFFQAFVRNQIGLDWSQISLVEWLERIYPIFSLIDEDCIYHTSVVAMAELIKHGCTTAFDHQYCYNSHAGKYLIDRQFQAADELGMRYVAGRGVNSLPPDQGSTMPVGMVESTDEYINDCERLITSFHDPDPFAMRSIVLAPCQPINCYEDTFTESLQLARQHNLQLHTHLSEGENFVMEKRHGMRSLDWCESIGFVGPDVWIAHGWEMTRTEMQRMAELEVGLSHCPKPMCLVGDGVTDIGAAYAAGVRIGIGVDGYASNDNSNLLDCIHQAYLLQCLVAKDREDPVPPAAEFLNFTTKGGASLLGRPELGCLAVGQAADFFAIDSRAIELVGAVHDPKHLLTKVGLGRPVDITVINGRVVWRNDVLTNIDEDKAAYEADQVFQKVIYQSDEMTALKFLH